MSFERGFENQEKRSGMEGLIAELASKSKYEHVLNPDNTETIKNPEYGEYNIKLLEDPNDPVVEKLHAHLLKNFGEEETIPLYWLKTTIAENKDQNFVVLDSNGEIAASMQSEYLELGSGGTVIYPCYLEVSEGFEKKGLGPEAMLAAYKKYDKLAKENNQKILGVIAESRMAAAGFNRRMGYKNVYFESKEGLKQVPYLCPPIEYDSATGERKGEPVPENLTMRLADGSNSLQTEKLLAIVKCIYEKYVDTEDSYESKEAYEKAHQDMADIFNKFSETVSQTNEVILLTSAEYKKKQINN